MAEMQYLASLKRVMSERTRKEKGIHSIAFPIAEKIERPQTQLKEHSMKVRASEYVMDRSQAYTRDVANAHSDIESKSEESSRRYIDSLMFVVPILNRKAHVFMGPVRSGYAECMSLFEESFLQQQMSHCEAILKCTAALVDGLAHETDDLVRSIELMNQARFCYAAGKDVQVSACSHVKSESLTCRLKVGDLLQQAYEFGARSNRLLCRACSACNLAAFRSFLNDHRRAHEFSTKAISLAMDPCCLTSDEFVGSQEICLRVLTAAARTQGKALLHRGDDFISSYEQAWNFASRLPDKFEALKCRIREEYLTALGAESARVVSLNAKSKPAGGQVFSRPLGTLLSRAHQEERTEVSLPLHSKLVFTLAVANACILQNAQRCHLARRQLNDLRQRGPSLVEAAIKLQTVFRGHLSRQSFERLSIEQRRRCALFLQRRVTEKLFEVSLSRRLGLQLRNSFSTCSHQLSLQPTPGDITVMLLGVADAMANGPTDGLSRLLVAHGLSARDLIDVGATAITEKEAQRKAINTIVERVAKTLTLERGNVLIEGNAIFNYFDPEARGTISLLKCRQALQTFGYSELEVEEGMAEMICRYGLEKDQNMLHPHFLELYVSLASNSAKTSASQCEAVTAPSHLPPFLLPSANAAAFTLQSAWKGTLARRMCCQKLGKQVTRLELGVVLRRVPAVVRMKKSSLLLDAACTGSRACRVACCSLRHQSIGPVVPSKEGDHVRPPHQTAGPPPAPAVAPAERRLLHTEVVAEPRGAETPEAGEAGE
eukprot:745963-Hanusia_phi.AAC.1